MHLFGVGWTPDEVLKRAFARRVGSIDRVHRLVESSKGATRETRASRGFRATLRLRSHAAGHAAAGCMKAGSFSVVSACSGVSVRDLRVQIASSDILSNATNSGYGDERR